MKNIYLFTATLTEAKPLLRLSENISEHFINKSELLNLMNSKFTLLLQALELRKQKKHWTLLLII